MHCVKFRLAWAIKGAVAGLAVEWRAMRYGGRGKRAKRKTPAGSTRNVGGRSDVADPFRTNVALRGTPYIHTLYGLISPKPVIFELETTQYVLCCLHTIARHIKKFFFSFSYGYGFVDHVFYLQNVLTHLLNETSPGSGSQAVASLGGLR
jgi:hypothetical protein